MAEHDPNTVATISIARPEAAIFAHQVAASSLGAQMKSTKSPRSALVRKQKIKKRDSRRKPILAEQYREIQWLRDLVKYLEGFDGKPRRN